MKKPEYIAVPVTDLQKIQRASLDLRRLLQKTIDRLPHDVVSHMHGKNKIVWQTVSNLLSIDLFTDLRQRSGGPKT